MIELPKKEETEFVADVLFPAGKEKILSVIRGLSNSRSTIRGFNVQEKNDGEFFIQQICFSRSFFWENKRVDVEGVTVKLEGIEEKTKVSLRFETNGSYVSNLGRDSIKRHAKEKFQFVTNAIYSQI